MTAFAGALFFANGASTSRSLAARFGESVNVKDFGARGDGSTNDTAAIQAAINAAFGSASAPHGSVNASLNKPLYFPSGHYITTAPLNLTALHGARIFGAGRLAVNIENTAGTSVIVTNACQYSIFEGIALTTSGTGVCFDLDYDGLGTWQVSCQSNTFRDMFFNSGAYGCRIAHSGGNSQGSENLFLNCFWIGQTLAGLAIGGTNALQNSVIGGNFQTCHYGIWAASGSMTKVDSVGFQESSLFDIRANDFVSNSMVISACRSESDNFAQIGLVAGARIEGALHTGTTGGTFVEVDGAVITIDNSYSNGLIQCIAQARMKVSNCVLAHPNPITTSSLTSFPNGNQFEACIDLERITYGRELRRFIRRRRITAANTNGDPLTRTYELEGASLTDSNVLYDSGPRPVTLSIASPCVATIGLADLLNGTPVIFSTTGSLPTGLTPGTVYYVVNTGWTVAQDNPTFRVSATSGGSAINTTGSQSGTHTVATARTVVKGDSVMNNSVAAGGSPGWICTTSGVVGATAVFKALANVAA